MDALESILPPVTKVPLEVNEENQTVQYVEHAAMPECYYPKFEKVNVEGKTCKANNFKIRHSVWKLATVARAIKGKHIYDAQNILNGVPRKSAEIMNTILNSARKNGVQEGLIEQRLFVKSVICGKGFLFKKLEIKGRSRMGIRKVPKCSVKLVLEEKSVEDFYKMLLLG